MTRGGLAAVAVLWAGGCSEQDFTPNSESAWAVVTGDFDDISEPLKRLSVRYDTYDGVVGRAAWNPDYDPATHTSTVEGLFSDLGVLRTYGGLAIASGARGFGDRVYNGADADDQFVGDTLLVDGLANWTGSGKVLFVTDWGYDLIERAWPGKIDFVGDDDVLDAAQTGIVEDVDARIIHDGLARALDTDTVRIRYNFSNWAPMAEVDDQVEVWMRGDVHFRYPGEELERELADVPLLVSFFPPEGGGLVVFATFHIDVQHDQVADEIAAQALGLR